MKDTPPAELLACPVAPAGFPEDATATIPASVRAPAIALATAYAGLTLQLVRLINWNAPGSCR
ncbi:hypothetical protein [Sphingomonas oryzagri]